MATIIDFKQAYIELFKEDIEKEEDETLSQELIEEYDEIFFKYLMLITHSKDKFPKCEKAIDSVCNIKYLLQNKPKTINEYDAYNDFIQASLSMLKIVLKKYQKEQKELMNNETYKLSFEDLVDFLK